MATAIGYLARPTADLISRIVATLEVSLTNLWVSLISVVWKWLCVFICNELGAGWVGSFTHTELFLAAAQLIYSRGVVNPNPKTLINPNPKTLTNPNPKTLINPNPKTLINPNPKTLNP